MKKLLAVALTVVSISNAHAELVTKNNEFRAIDLPPEFRLTTQGVICKFKVCPLSLNFANIAIGRDGFRPGIVTTPIEFALGGPHWPKPPKEDNVIKYESIEFASNGGLCPPLLCSDGVNPT
ncbi:hypothetical protein H0A36_07795 [Endozoicomonas sp. SM1973]|uniref:Uncharacterized protein n=1 Tax=Spartinivicinus marinus TaxID=2994442 RepID=A0A853I9H0_9GAMM|nr:hypothetical protein [Spartinivicinus marinus]MCX4029176.1 hypothetical protein [Spartinivicinus marinus]NYZ65915.1 hypothetical protein [Spartinivicinus marinus]